MPRKKAAAAMRVRNLAPSKLSPYWRNPRRNETAIDKVAESIREFGFRQPILVDGDHVIVTGHTRHAAAIRLGLETVTVIVADDLSDAQLKAYRIADNRVAEESEWDEDLLKQELGELSGEADHLVAALGFDEDELADLVVALEDDEEIPAGKSEATDEDDGADELVRRFGGATSLSRSSAPLRYWSEQQLLEGKVLDFGCGHEHHGHARYDAFTAPDVEPLRESYDVVMCNYVLNVQPSDHLVDLVIGLVSRLVRPGGVALFAVLTDPELSGSASMGGREAKSVDEWRRILARWFDQVERPKRAGFPAFVCS